MTALLASLGLLPAAMSHAIGSDTQRPFAIVIIGGLISSTLLTMLLLPTLYELARSLVRHRTRQAPPDGARREARVVRRRAGRAAASVVAVAAAFGGAVTTIGVAHAAAPAPRGGRAHHGRSGAHRARTQPRGDRGAPRHRGRAARRRRGAHLPEPGGVVLGGKPRARQSATTRAAPCRRSSSASRCRPSASARSSTSGPSAARARAPPSAASSSGTCKSRTLCARSSMPCARRSPTSCASRTSGSWRARSPIATATPCACRAGAFAPATSPRRSCAGSSSRGCATQTR